MKRITSKRYLVIGAAILVLIAVFGLLRPLLKPYFLNVFYRADDQVAAIFDRKGGSRVLPAGSVYCYNVVWRNTARWSEKSDIETALANHDVLITVETWLWGVNFKTDVLTEVIRGGFDKNIHDLASLVSKSGHKVYIRWDPDMEIPTNSYPWQYQSPQAYIAAFNYFAERLKREAPNVRIVWAPSGYPGDTEFWPGDKNVDDVSITLGSRSENSTHFYPAAKTIPEMIENKLHRLRFINKPVLVMGSNDVLRAGFRPEWVTRQQAYINKYSSTVYAESNYTDTGKAKPVRTILKVGVFDPNKKLISQKGIGVEHLFTDLGELQRGEFEKKFAEVIGRGHEVIVTMEPWKDVHGNADTLVLEKILNGKFDHEIEKLFSIISSTNEVVYLRWMHEMEIPIHRYAWQSQDPVTYINAFRYFMQYHGGPGKNVKKVWGPAGDRGSVDFWPGSDVVDYISIAIYGLPDKNITDPNKQEWFSAIFKRKYYRMRFLDKPLFITEFGVKGPEAFQDKWLADAAKTINASPHVFGICYFNLYDNPKAWGNIKAPDWSITPRSMSKFCGLLNK